MEVKLGSYLKFRSHYEFIFEKQISTRFIVQMMTTDIGKKIRLSRILNSETKRMIVIPMDHGLTVGPLRGINDFHKMVEMVVDGGANAVLGHSALFLHTKYDGDKNFGRILHLSGNSDLSPNKYSKVLVSSVTDAVKLGADAVSVHINIGNEDDSLMLEDLGEIAQECREWSMPLLAMMYPRGDNITDEFSVENVRKVARIGAELGADIVKTNYTGSIDSFKEVVEGCPVPVIIAGGTEKNLMELLQLTKDCIEAGGAGVSFGRNIFQSRDPTTLTQAISLIVHQNYSISDAISEAQLKINGK
jgi:fructose-bisphosphate aldolase/2-amino-3,7-dideoxy-D-threo-hept-6-ulosonate synthase